MTALGALKKGFFVIGDEAKDNYLIYNKKDVLSYDADRSGTKCKAVEVAQLSRKLTLKADDFQIIYAGPKRMKQEGRKSLPTTVKADSTALVSGHEQLQRYPLAASVRLQPLRS